MTESAVAPPARNLEFWIVSSVLVAALIALAAAAAWPIYARGSFLVLVIVASLVGAGLALLGDRRRWGAAMTALTLLLAYLVLGIPLAMPGAFDTLLTAIGQLIVAPVTSWMQLVTIELPVGLYQATAVPALIVFLVGSTLALRFVWRTGPESVWSVPVLIVMNAFGPLFGASTVSEPLRLGSLVVPAPREIALSLSTLILLVVLLRWRAGWLRRQALYRARRASGVRGAPSPMSAALRRGMLAAGILVVAGTVAGMAVAPALNPTGREVLRTSIEPELRLRDEVSPLSTYRSAFAVQRWQAELFTVEVRGSGVDRLRLAVLTEYDGGVFRVAPTARAQRGDEGADFRRVPAEIPGRTADSRAGALTLTIGELGGLWMPLSVEPARIEFAGSRRSALVNGFFYSRSLDAGIQLVEGGLQPGDVVRIEPAVSPRPALDQLRAMDPTGREVDAALPESLVDWVSAQGVTMDGAGLQTLVDRLRARGFLSHSLHTPPAEANWTAALGDYSFVPSRSGHDITRIGQIFSDLLERERELGNLDDESMLVAAVGDDEQFSVAAALLARHFGYESRVVLGVRLDDSSGILAPAACERGVCRGANLTAWAEVREPGGAWAVVDATPQFANPVLPSVTTVRDPELPTNVPSQTAQTRLPPESSPTEGEAGSETIEDREEARAGWVWPILRIAGIVLLIVMLPLAPVLAVLIAKGLRRGARRRAADPDQRIAGGWLEWIDTAVDHGASVPHNATRSEIVAALRSSGSASDLAPELALRADRAVFAATASTMDEGDAYWQIVDAERERWRADRGLWQRVLAAVTLRSFVRTAVRGSSIAERGTAKLTSGRGSRGRGITRFPKGVTRVRRAEHP